MGLEAFEPALLLLVGAIATGLGGLLGVGLTYLQSKAKVKAELQLKKDSARADFEMMKDNAKLATQAAEQLGKTNEERRLIALALQDKWNKNAGISLPVDQNLNEANVPTITKVPIVEPSSISPDPTAKG